MKRQMAGATTVEFALGLLVFLMLVLGIVDFARMLFTWSAANEATRAGARYAVLPQITTVSVAWTPAGCTASTCEGVTVGITGLNYQWISPIVGAASPLIPMPSFSTFLPREVMRKDPHSPTICS
jgi:Flp pilus assembly protein TadG